MKRLGVLFLPSILGLIWQDPAISIGWSIGSSLFIAALAQTRWFRESGEDRSFTSELLRPLFIFHLFFVIAHVVGGAFFALDNAGYSPFGQIAEPSQYRLSINAAAQAFMLLAHASVTAGMKLAKLKYDSPKYLVASIPPYALLVLSFGFSVLGNAFGLFPSLFNLAGKILDISSTAVFLELVFAIRRGHFTNTVVSALLIVLNLVAQTLSGWKGLTLWSMITLAAMLYPLMPRRVLLGVTGFVLFWAFFLHPFGLEFRPLNWAQGVDQDTAVTISLDHTSHLSWRDRVEGVWFLMVGRANELSQFQRYLEYVPENHPYYELDLAAQSVIALVPRVFWPGKPDLEKLSMERVYAAGVVSRQSPVSAKSNFYQDAYLSWGWVAIIGASMMLGFLTMVTSRACERYFGGYQIGTCLIYTSLFGPDLRAAPNFLFWVGVILTALVTMFGLFLLGRMMGWLVPARPSSSTPPPVPTGLVFNPIRKPARVGVVGNT